MSEKIVLVPPDPSWPGKFRAEKASLIRLLKDPELRIAHFGSTSIPGLYAKPIIDILIGCPDMKKADRILPKLAAYGYETSARFNTGIGERRFLRKRKNRFRTHHIHLVVFQGPFWRDSIRFRNILRKDAILAKRYEKLKLATARRNDTDREAYTEAKTPFITEVLRIRKPKAAPATIRRKPGLP
jgi:GrpB-like predicted nucleotidyltransferase (UPF0157 family)